MIRTIAAVAGFGCLLLCIIVAILHFQGNLGAESFRQIFAISSLGWFVAATTWATRRKRG